MINIPSNFSVDEIIRYGNIPEPAKSAVEKLQDRLIELEEENESLNRRNEIISEQWYFCKKFIESTKIRCESATNCKDLVSEIITELDNSYIEL